jgi:ribosomal 30S subunit maturation factor RimM
MMLRRAGWTAAVLGLMTWSVGYGQQRQTAPGARPREQASQAGQGQLYKCSDLIGMQVRGENDAELGKVKDLLINSGTQEVEFATLDKGLPAGPGGKETVIPFIIVDAHVGPEVKDKYLSVSMTEEKFNTAPQINLADAELTANADWTRQVNQFFESEMHQRRTARPELRDSNAPRENAPRERSNQQSRRNTDRPGAAADTQRAQRGQSGHSASQLYKASDLIGMNVRGENNAELGKIQDLLVNSRTEEVEFATLGGGLLAASDKSTVIPWIIADPHVGPGAEDHFVSVALTEQRFKTAPQINLASAELTANADWTREVNQYFETEMQQRRTARPDLGEEGARGERQRDSNRSGARRNPEGGQQGRSGQGEQPKQPKP